jgi:hypothetical protein
VLSGGNISDLTTSNIASRDVLDQQCVRAMSKTRTKMLKLEVAQPACKGSGNHNKHAPCITIAIQDKGVCKTYTYGVQIERIQL